MNIKTHILSILVLYSGLTGCMLNTGPKNNSEFSNITDIREFVGIYRNAGEPSGYLSDIIWKGALPAHDVVSVNVELSREGALHVSALDGSGKVLREQLFEQGKDFKMCQGRICLKNSTRVVGVKAQDPMLGIGSEYTELGLDQIGDGKFRSGGTAVGLGYMIIPIAISGKDDIRFVKLRK